MPNLRTIYLDAEFDLTIELEASLGNMFTPKQDITFKQGNDLVLSFTVTDQNSNPVNMSSASLITLSLSVSPEETASLTSTTATISGLDNNIVSITVTAAASANLKGKFFLELTAVKAGKVSTMATGIATILPARNS